MTALLNFGKYNRMKMIRQSENSECGLACLAMIAGYHGFETDMNTLRRRFEISSKGIDLGGLISIAQSLQFTTEPGTCDVFELPQLKLPCILHWELKHFVVLTKVRKNSIEIYNPAVGEQDITIKELEAGLFSGPFLQLTPGGAFQKRKEKTPIDVFDFIKFTPDIKNAFIQAFLISGFLELFTLLSPFYMQFVIDEAIGKGDHDLLVGLTFAFGLLQIFNLSASTMRTYIFQYIGNTMSFGIRQRLFQHLIRLPLSYFQKRNVGDLLQRFNSMDAASSLIIGGGISSVLDGVLATITLVFMFNYSVNLTLLILGAFIVYALLRTLTRQISRRLSAASIVASAKEQTKFLETLRVMQTIKVNCGESNRQQVWQKLYGAKLDSAIRLNKVQIRFQVFAGVITKTTDFAVLYVAASYAIDGLMTIGVITAFMAYKGQFLERMTSLLDQLTQFWMLEVQLSRVGDIALTSREQHLESRIGLNYQLQGGIELRNIDFSYSAHERKVVNNVNLEIKYGEFICIIGESGGGKSTLLKLIMGLNTPTNGQILFDDIKIDLIGMNTLRKQIGVVMQEDRLLAGTIADNIALFEETVDQKKVEYCARLACIDSEIQMFPQKYNSLVGDMGSSLSSGQKQRVLIARALYRDPQILIMDEGTAHLNSTLDKQIQDMLCALPITRIVVAHSLQMAARADRVFNLNSGKLVEVFNYNTIVQSAINV